MNKLPTAEQIMIKHGCAFVQGTEPTHFIEAMHTYACLMLDEAEQRILNGEADSGVIQETISQLKKEMKP